MEILETQERKMNKNKEKKRELTHFLGHYRSFYYILYPVLHNKKVYSIHTYTHNSILTID